MATLALGLPDALDQPLADRFLLAIGAAEGDRGLADGPAQAWRCRPW